MRISYNVTGAERKTLVGAISSELNLPTKYLGMPTAAYEIGEYTIDKTGTVTGPDNLDLEDALHQQGFDAEIREYDEPDTYESGLGGMGAVDEPAFEDLKLTEREELGLGRERRENWQGENGMQASDVLESEATAPNKSALPRLYTLETPRGEIFIAEEFATHDEAAAEGYGEYFSTALGTVYSYGDNHTFALVTSNKAGDWDKTAIKRDFRAQESEVPENRTYRAELSDPDCPDRMEVFGAADDEDAIRQAYEYCEGEVVLLELLELDDDYNVIRGVDLWPESNRLVIEMPLAGFTPEKLDNLAKLVNAKAPLLKAALGTDDLPIQQTADTLKFPWFGDGLDADTVKAYASLIGMICAAAKAKHRVIAQEKDPENKKYAMRCWLLSLGFIGDEYKTSRKILLSNLSGNSSFKSGAFPKTTESEVG